MRKEQGLKSADLASLNLRGLGVGVEESVECLYYVFFTCLILSLWLGRVLFKMRPGTGGVGDLFWVHTVQHLYFPRFWVVSWSPDRLAIRLGEKCSRRRIACHAHAGENRINVLYNQVLVLFLNANHSQKGTPPVPRKRCQIRAQGEKTGLTRPVSGNIHLFSLHFKEQSQVEWTSPQVYALQGEEPLVLSHYTTAHQDPDTYMYVHIYFFSLATAKS